MPDSLPPKLAGNGESGMGNGGLPILDRGMGNGKWGMANGEREMGFEFV